MEKQIGNRQKLDRKVDGKIYRKKNKKIDRKQIKIDRKRQKIDKNRQKKDRKQI